MQVFPSRNQFRANPASSALLSALLDNEQQLGLQDSLLYHSFPLYRDEEGGVVVADCVLLSQKHGVVTFALTTASNVLAGPELERCQAVAEQVPSYVQSRLVKNRQLRKGPTKLAFDITPVVYGPGLTSIPDLEGISVVTSEESLCSFFEEFESAISVEMFQELIATIEGAKGLIRPKKRDLTGFDTTSKGKQAELVEAAITLFDQQQKHGMMGRIGGPQRIRGLAGSGKTVVLAMKAAQTHLQFPDAKIAYTFSTKSLYQHVKRLITRFYRQFDDRDPDWDNRLKVVHGWGSSSTPGLYSIACEQHGIQPLSFQDAARSTIGDKFDFACKSLTKAAKIKPIFDYVFVDEGQDFPLSFIRLCHSLAQDGRFALAYDDLQTIFQATTPSTADIFGTDDHGKPLATFEEDIVLHKCYRNPREVLVSAHALGFGLYGDRIVQMLESREHWEDIGYTVESGDFVAESPIRLERPKENSLAIISDISGFDEIVQAKSFTSQADEIKAVASSVADDLNDGLQPEDILVVSVDDRSAKSYLSGIENALSGKGIQCNNLHSDAFGIRDFSKDGRVTLSTVHKAKGNEAFMVYVVGSDAVMFRSDVRKRNMLFVAMTRAKGWVRVSGVGDQAKQCVKELSKAKANFPYLTFRYPGPDELKVMKRDLEQAAEKKLRARRLLDQLQEEFSAEEISEMLKDSKKSGSSRRKPRRKE
jgi:superfamily I DNA and RNA helicase